MMTDGINNNKLSSQTGDSKSEERTLDPLYWQIESEEEVREAIRTWDAPLSTREDIRRFLKAHPGLMYEYGPGVHLTIPYRVIVRDITRVIRSMGGDSN